jgi:hypothetical protein
VSSESSVQRSIKLNVKGYTRPVSPIMVDAALNNPTEGGSRLRLFAEPENRPASALYTNIFPFHFLDALNNMRDPKLGSKNGDISMEKAIQEMEKLGHKISMAACSSSTVIYQIALKLYGQKYVDSRNSIRLDDALLTRMEKMIPPGEKNNLDDKGVQQHKTI